MRERANKLWMNEDNILDLFMAWKGEYKLYASVDKDVSEFFKKYKITRDDINDFLEYRKQIINKAVDDELKSSKEYLEESFINGLFYGTDSVISGTQSENIKEIIKERREQAND